MRLYVYLFIYFFRIQRKPIYLKLKKEEKEEASSYVFIIY